MKRNLKIKRQRPKNERISSQLKQQRRKQSRMRRKKQQTRSWRRKWSLTGNVIRHGNKKGIGIVNGKLNIVRRYRKHSILLMNSGKQTENKVIKYEQQNLIFLRIRFYRSRTKVILRTNSSKKFFRMRTKNFRRKDKSNFRWRRAKRNQRQR